MSDEAASPRGTMDQRVAEIRARLDGTTRGPWLVWDGHEYKGGGRDLCIGAGPTWLLNMDHRLCERADEHSKAYMNESDPAHPMFCGLAADAAVCSVDSEIGAEQQANANFIARAREDVPFLLDVITYLSREVENAQNETWRLRHPDHEDFAPALESLPVPVAGSVR